MLTYADGSPVPVDAPERDPRVVWFPPLPAPPREETVVMCREPKWNGWCERFVVEGTDRCPAHQPGQLREE